MAPQIQKVALAGASGTLGKPMLHALLAANFDVTVLTRHTSTATFPPQVSQTIRVDYENLEQLKSALQGQDALVSTVTTSSITAQELLIDAAIAAGVKRFIPSEFGSDASNPNIRQIPMYADKIKIETTMKEKCGERGCEMTWTAVYCSCFLDWGIDHKFYLDLDAKKCQLYDGGDFPTATSPTDWVAEAVCAILRGRVEETKNRAVRIAGCMISQRELLEIAQDVVGREGWEVREVRTEEMYRDAMEVLRTDPGDLWGWLMGMLVRGVFGEGFTRDFGGERECDNEMLGLRSVTRGEVEMYVRRYVEKGKSGRY